MTEFELVRHRLCESRRAGVDFDAAWRRALATSREREALKLTEGAWRRAYDRAEQTDAERAVGVIANAELGFELVDDDSGSWRVA